MTTTNENWIKAFDQLPSVIKHGERVLLYRLVDRSHEGLEICVTSTNIVKYYNPNETWWMELPEPPIL